MTRSDTERPLRILAVPTGRGPQTNPYVRQLYEHLIRLGAVVVPLSRRRLLGRWDVVHVHWPETLVSWARPAPAVAWEIVKVLGCLWTARRRGARLVWTGHNVEWHEMSRPRLYNLYLRAFTGLVDLLITLSDASHGTLSSRYPSLRAVPHVTIPHGHYRDVYPPPPPQDLSRHVLGLPADVPVVLVMGQIRRYKNVPDLISAFRELNHDTVLVVAGSTQGDAALEAELRQSAADDRRVRLRFGHVPDPEVSVLHSAADVVVLPYESPSLLNSGAAILALSLGKPVVMRRTPSTAELVRLVGEEWVLTYDGGGPREALARAENVMGAPPIGQPRLTALEWEVVSASTLRAMYALVGRCSGASTD